MIGKRGRKKAPINHPDTETRTGDEKVRCVLCLEHNSIDYGHGETAGWMTFESFKRSHVKSAGHKRAVDAKKRVDDLENGRLQQDPGSFAQPSSFTIEDPPSRTEENPHIPKCWPTDIDNLMAGFDGTFSLDKGYDEIRLDSHAAFAREAEEHAGWRNMDGEIHSAGVDILDELDEEEDQDALLRELLNNINISRTDQSTAANAAEWSPYPSKTVFLLDVVDNLPRNRISGGFMKVLLWLLSELNVDGVPSFDKLRSIQKTLREEKGVPTVQGATPKGHQFSFNDLRTLLSNDWSNPLVRPHIRRYPVIPKNGIISEIWHAQKWRKDLDRTCLSPMYDAGHGQHFYVDELAVCGDGKMVIPVRWLEDEMGSVWCEAWRVHDDGATASINDGDVEMIKASDLRKDFPTLQDEDRVPRWSAETVEKGLCSRMPNPDRKLACGDPIYSSFVDIFGDDVSGNRSKSWNKHWNIYMTHRNLPRKLLFQSYHTHFISTSTHASVPEQFHGIKAVIDKTHRNPIVTRDALTGQPVRLKVFCNCAPGDNPSQSETSGHIGGKGNFPCRKCKIGGSQEEKATNQDFHKMFTAGVPRTTASNVAAIEAQLELACSGVAQHVKDMQTNSGIKDMYTQHWVDDLIDRARQLQRADPDRPLPEIKAELVQWVEDHQSTIINPFLTLKGFDAPADTPVEILHTILLGVVKYVWHGSHTSWSKSQKAIFTQRLRATDTLSLNIASIRSNYIMQYANSLNGKQLKLLAQVNVFHVHDLVDDLQFQLTKAIGELASLLWITEIHKMDEYLHDVETAAANVLDIAAEIDPSKIVSKIKYHLLSHLREDILRFGPLVGVATETFECFNAVFRYCSILSNHIAPSRDIAYQLAEQETLKHILSGGWWKSRKTGEWEQAGSHVRQYIERHPTIQKLLGWTNSDDIAPAGSITLQSVDRKKSKSRVREMLAWNNTQGDSAVNAMIPEILAGFRRDEVVWYRGKYVVAQSQDRCECGSWAYAESPFSVKDGPLSDSEAPIVGRIIDILQANNNVKTSRVVIDLFEVRSTRDGVFGMPVLIRPFNEKRTVIVDASKILFSFNAQHNCKLAGCTASGSRFTQEERTATTNTENFIEHQGIDEYLVNLHAFHNAHLIRRVLPRNVTAPIPYAEDRLALHHAQSAKLRSSRLSKRAAAAAAKATAAEGQAASTAKAPSRKRRRTEEDDAEPGNEMGIAVEHDSEGR